MASMYFPKKFYMKYFWKISSSYYKPLLVSLFNNCDQLIFIQNKSMSHVSNKRITRIQSDVEIVKEELKQDGNEKYIQVNLRNRNPRNLEQMLMEPKPTGYEMDQKNPHYWNRLVFEKKSKYLIGKIVHNSGRILVEASTNEPSLAIFLGNSRSDLKSAIILGQILAMRSLEFGIHSVFCDQLQQQQQHDSGEKLSSFIDALQKNGLHLTEQPMIVLRAQRDH